MKLLFLASGSRVPSCRFRIFHIVPHLRAAGHRCTIASSFPQKYDHFEWLGFRPSQWLKRIVRHWHLLRARCVRYDAVILERELFHNPTWDMERRFRKVAKTLVLDLDDAVFLNFPEKLPELVKMADLVIAGNRNLEDWARTYHAHVVVIPTCVDVDFFRPRQRLDGGGRPPIIGWIGTAGNVAYLKEVAPAVRSLARRHEFEMRIVASGRGALDEIDLQGVNVRFLPWDPDTEAAEIANFDIGLMPLPDDPWSRYKCGLKLLQYMACGVPGVASPVGVNADIINQGQNGFLAATAGEWESAIERFVCDPDLRQHVGASARRTVEREYSVAANLPRWISAVEAACQRSSAQAA